MLPSIQCMLGSVQHTHARSRQPKGQQQSGQVGLVLAEHDRKFTFCKRNT